MCHASCSPAEHHPIIPPFALRPRANVSNVSKLEDQRGHPNIEYPEGRRPLTDWSAILRNRHGPHPGSESIEVSRPVRGRDYFSPLLLLPARRFPRNPNLVERTTHFQLTDEAKDEA